jgi:hypothetical protein
MAKQTGTTEPLQGRADEPRTSTRPSAGITQEQQNTGPLNSPASGASTMGAAGTAGSTEARRSEGITGRERQQMSGTGSDRSGGNGSKGIAGFVRDAASNRLTQQKERATRGLGEVARAVRQSTDQLRDQGQDTVARYVEQAADGLDRIAHGLESQDVRQMVENVQSFARRQPLLFVGTALGLGFVGARFLKSSRRQRDSYSARDRGYSQQAGWRAVTAPPSTANPPLTPLGETGR